MPPTEGEWPRNAPVPNGDHRIEEREAVMAVVTSNRRSPGLDDLLAAEVMTRSPDHIGEKLDAIPVRAGSHPAERPIRRSAATCGC